MQDAEKVKKDIMGKFSKGFASVTAGTLGFFYGGIANQAKSAVMGLGDMIGRGTDIGRNASEFWGKVGAKQTAAQQTVEAFGLAGKNASKEQVLSVYNMFKSIEEMRAASRANVEGSIGEKETADLMKQSVSDFKFAVNHFKEVVNEFMRGTGWRWR